jgi:adenine/guanine phosphoribosyltransferase-like PRPP-binding protein
MLEKDSHKIDYIAFNEASGVVKAYPQAAQLNPFIRVICQFKAPPQALFPVQNLQLSVEQQGYALSIEHLPV